MRYKTISKECVVRLSEQGYSLSDGDRSFIDEVTMIVLAEDPEGSCTDEEIIERILSLGKRHLKPVPDNGNDAETERIANEGTPSTGLWSSVFRFISSRMTNPKG